MIAQTQNGQQKILTMHSIQSVKAKEIEQGTSYLLLMEENLKTLDEALNTI